MVQLLESPALQGTRVQSLVGALRSHMLWGNELTLQPLGISATMREFMCHTERSHMLQLRPSAAK